MPYLGLQGVGSNSPIQGDGKAGRVLGDSVLAVVLIYGGTGRTLLLITLYWQASTPLKVVLTQYKRASTLAG